jgi:hypothetical protein
MILSLLAARPYLQKTLENFTDRTEEDQITVNVLSTIFVIIFGIISSYGAARLSYFYNMNTGNSGYAVFWSVLAFLFSDLYYPMYSYFLNPQSAKGRNNIPVPPAIANL